MERTAHLNSPLRYPVPWDVVFGLTRYLRDNQPCSFNEVSRAVADRVKPEPVVEGVDKLPSAPRFVLVANHYERKGLWIAHSACALTQTLRRHYELGDPPVRWMVTSNWPPLRIGSLKIPSPGDVLLPRVARVLSCYAVPLSGSDPSAAARSIRQLLRDARKLDSPIGLFPEGARGRAGRIGDALPGVGRLLQHLARLGFGVQPVGISETGSQFVFRFGDPFAADEVSLMADPGRRVMDAIRDLAT